MASFVLSFSHLDVLDEIWDLIESVSEGFLTYSCTSATPTLKNSSPNNLPHGLTCVLQVTTPCTAAAEELKMPVKG